jgi:4-methylaminobutanoate oxidase (formaldehyde-forming)
MAREETQPPDRHEGDPLPPSAKVVIVGGGVLGCSTAYHLARLGVDDVVVLEQHALSSGSTWHAAGAVAQYRPNANLMALARYSVDLYSRLEEETGLSTGLRRTGGMRVTTSPERRREYERSITTARSFGLEMHLLSPAEAGELFPIMETADLDCAVYVPTDGVVGPSDLNQALARGARTGGVRIHEHVAVTGFDVRDGRVVAVETDAGGIACESVAICCGIWSRELARLAGVNVPIWPSRHCYFITEPFPELDPDWPTNRDPDLWHYFVPTGSGLIVGQYEPDPTPWDTASIPRGWAFRLLPEDSRRFTRLLTPLARRVPLLESVEVYRWFHGLEAFTEDQNPVVGPAPEVEGLFVAAGFNAYGVSVAGGFGMALAEWIARGSPPFDLWPCDVRRFSSIHRSDATVRTLAAGGQGRHYAIHFPYEEIPEARPLRRSPLYDRLAARGACFGQKAGWERPNWFAPPGVEPVDHPSFGRQSWLEHAAAEHEACREGVVLFDLSSFAKARVTGRDAEAVLQRLCTADVGAAPGSVRHTLLLNDRGGIEADLTVARLAEHDYLVVTGSGFAVHDFGLLRHGVATADHAHVLDVTSSFATLALAGPRSRELLAAVCERDVSNEAFPFASAAELVVAGAPAVALRVSYSGELAFELYVPTEYTLTVFDALERAGERFGLRHAGYRALDSLRLEKANKVWGVDIGPDYTPLEAGIRYALAFDKEPSFRGRDTLVEQLDAPLTKRLLTFTTDDPDAVLLGRETIWRDGEPVGWLTSGGYGHTVGCGVGLGWVRSAAGVGSDFLDTGRWELEVLTRRVPARAHARALYDPDGVRMRA